MRPLRASVSLRFRARRPLVLLLLAAVAAIPAEAQEKAAPASPATPEKVFFESLNVHLVNVDVYVTDKEGRRVTGLTKDDFELFEDGRPVEITNFTAVAGRPRRVRPARPAPPGAQPAPETATAATPAEDGRLHLVLCFDNLFLRPFDRNKVMRDVRQFVFGRVAPQDQVMVVTLERGLHVRQPFTSDPRLVATALDGLEKLTGFAVQGQEERRDVLQRVERSRDRFEAESMVDLYADSVYNDMVQSIRNLKDLVGSLAGLPGRKMLLYVSDGPPMTAAQGLFYLLDEKFPGQVSAQLKAGRWNAHSQFRELIASANANRVTFYTLEAEGLRSHSSLSAERGTLQTSMIDVDDADESSQEETLEMLAADTGGLAALNTNNFGGALAKMGDDFAAYYSLGFLPSHQGDGRYYPIEVRVKRKGVSVRYRSGYRDKTPETRVAEGTLASLLFGVDANPIDVELTTDVAKPRDDGLFLVPLSVRIPLGKVALVPQGDFRVGQVRVSVAVIDEKGRTSDPEQQSLDLRIPVADLPGALDKFYVYTVSLLMRRGEHSIGVGVVDDLAGESSFVRLPVRVGF